MTANAASFLLPTSNITNLLLLGRAPLTTAAYVGDSWLPWILVTALTIGALTPWIGGGAAAAATRPAGPDLSDDIWDGLRSSDGWGVGPDRRSADGHTRPVPQAQGPA